MKGVPQGDFLRGIARNRIPSAAPSEGFNLLGWLAPFALLPRLDLGFCYRRTVSEAERLIARFHDMAVMREPIQQRCRHLGIAKYTWPLGKGQVCRNHHTGVLIEL